jgi:hypothetical protein
MTMRPFQTTLLALAGVIAIAFGLRYMLATRFMEYHAAVAGSTWAELPAGVQAIVLGMYTIMGGGFITYGAALLWLLLPLRDGEAWAAVAALTLSVTALVPVIYVTVWLRRIQPAARTPVVPAVVVFVLAVVGAGASLLP